MDTLVTIQLVGSESSASTGAAIGRAFGWFREIEERCTRFDERSELMKLTAQVGVPVPVSVAVAVNGVPKLVVAGTPASPRPVAVRLPEFTVTL